MMAFLDDWKGDVEIDNNWMRGGEDMKNGKMVIRINGQWTQTPFLSGKN